MQKPRGLLHPRVQAVGPEHFGVVCVDCAKARSKWMLCDFYGTVRIPPQEVGHNRVELDFAVAQIEAACRRHELRDRVVVIERTGRYHLVVRRVFDAAGFETRIVHPYTTKQLRQPADPNTKTDDTDLMAIHRAAVNGFALREAVAEEPWRCLQLLARHRRDLVRKAALLCCQMREHLEAAYPGYAACFDNLWDSKLALPLVRQWASAADFVQAGIEGLTRWVRERRLRCHQQTLHTLLAWAQNAAPADPAAGHHRAIALALDEDRLRKTQEIQGLERTLAHLLVQTGYVRLLSMPGINVVWAAELAGEAGPMSHYLSPKNLTGRAGLFPSRYQSDRVDRASGPLVRRGHRRLRAVLLGVADSLIMCGQYFRALSARWRARGDDPRLVHVRVAARFSRIGFHLVAGNQLFRHPAVRERSYILDKLLAFHLEHDTPLPEALADLHLALAQIPAHEYPHEAQPLAERLRHSRRAKGPQPLGELIAVVLARLGVGMVQSTASGEIDPR
ncbi:MAG: transposase [Acidobacteria bacterium]|nr:transposase [Acidobacteriota bacterium]